MEENPGFELACNVFFGCVLVVALFGYYKVSIEPGQKKMEEAQQIRQQHYYRSSPREIGGDHSQRDYDRAVDRVANPPRSNPD